MTTNVSRPSSSLTSYCSLRSTGIVREGHTAGTKDSARTGEIDFLLLLFVEVLLGQGIETGRHDGVAKGDSRGAEQMCGL